MYCFLVWFLAILDLKLKTVLLLNVNLTLLVADLPKHTATKNIHRKIKSKILRIQHRTLETMRLLEYRKCLNIFIKSFTK